MQVSEHFFLVGNATPEEKQIFRFAQDDTDLELRTMLHAGTYLVDVMCFGKCRV